MSHTEASPMKGTDFASIASNLDSNADTTEIVDALTEMATAMDDLEGRVDELEGRVDDLEDQLGDEKEQRGQADAQVRGRVHDVEERVEDVEETVCEHADPTPNGGQTTVQPGELTPVEQLARADDVEAVTDSASVRRAVTLFDNLEDWGRKAPKGVVLKPSDNPLSLLKAACGESLCWKQWYRCAETLESLSEGAVTFFDSDRHGKMVCLHEQSEVFDRVTSGELSPSSARAEV